ncbi:MAG: hypothetical protein RIR18_2254, partial [Pseudomonadota bacterium]
LDERLDPLVAIESSIKEFFEVVIEQPSVLKMFEIMVLRCEYVKEFAQVRQVVNQPALDFLAKLKKVYQRAVEQQVTLEGLSSDVLARDTWVFTSGLLNQLLLVPDQSELRERMPEMVRAHMVLRTRR